MNHSDRDLSGQRDPLGLATLPDPQPTPGGMEADWAVVSAHLVRRSRRRRAWTAGLAAAASIALVTTLLVMSSPGTTVLSPPTGGEQTAALSPPAEDTGTETPPSADVPGTAELIAMSQGMERQLRFLRRQVGSMPSSVVAYQVELQDLIGQVDDALSLAPDSTALWSQRLGLQMDLVRLYRGQLRRDYSNFASL